MQGVIYKVTNMVNGKIYIGQTINPKTRWRDHVRNAYFNYGEEYNTIFKRAIRKYGHEAFSFDIIFKIRIKGKTDTIRCKIKDIINKEEIRYIEFYDSANKSKGYNISNGGSGNKGVYPSEETRIKMSESQKNSWNDDRRKKISESMKGENNHMHGVSLSGSLNPMYGRSHSEGAKIKISEALKGRIGHKHSDETKKLLSDLNKGKPKSDLTKKKLRDYFTGRPNVKNRKEVWQFDLCGNYIATWEGITVAEKSLGITHISCCCRLARRESGGFQWRFKTDGIEPTILEYRKKPIPKKRKPSPYMKPIIQYSIDMEFIKEWSSLTEIESSLGFSRSNIRESIKKNGFSYGFKWNYK